MTDTNVWLTVTVIALVTAATRFLPFIVFNGERKTPRLIRRLGQFLPHAVMGMLVVYCLKDVSFTEAAGFLPPMIACLAVGGLYVWKRNTLVSIIVGTACYMLLVQVAF